MFVFITVNNRRQTSTKTRHNVYLTTPHSTIQACFSPCSNVFTLSHVYTFAFNVSIPDSNQKLTTWGWQWLCRALNLLCWEIFFLFLLLSLRRLCVEAQKPPRLDYINFILFCHSISLRWTVYRNGTKSHQVLSAEFAIRWDEKYLWLIKGLSEIT